MLSLLHPDPECRPSVDAIVRSELLLALHKSIRQRKHSAGGRHDWVFVGAAVPFHNPDPPFRLISQFSGTKVLLQCAIRE